MSSTWSIFDDGGGFGAFTFYAHQHGTEECDSRGLPLTPNSIIMTGNFQELKTISHSNLCTYLDLIKCRNEERLMCVSEYYNDNLEKHISSGRFNNLSSLGKLSYQILNGLNYLHKRNIHVRNLSSSNIMITSGDKVKIFNYGLFHITSCEKAVRFPVGYLAPEILLATKLGKHETVVTTTKSDVWSFGIILLEVVMKSHIFPDLFLKNGLNTLFTRIIRLVVNEQKNATSPLQALLDIHSCSIRTIDQQIQIILQNCLSSFPSARRAVSEIMDNPFIKEHSTTTPISPRKRDPFKNNGFCTRDLQETHPPPPITTLEQAREILNKNHLTSWDIKNIYFIWRLAGGDVKAELSKHGLIPSRTPILTLPVLVSKDGTEFGIDKTTVNHYDSRVISLPVKQLKSRLESMTVEDYYPLLKNPETMKCHRQKSLKDGESQAVEETSKLPLLIKESDIEYQFHRVVLYRQLLEGYPYTREMVITEAVTDVCCYYRGPIWAAILNVKGDISTKYTNIDKDTETLATDRQIAVDIPRCHQYDLLLASRQGHLKFKRILKAWIASHPDLVYWQGLDSLCAPFIALNFNNEALAYSCLSAFIDKFLMDFFKKKNSELMQEYLAIFSHMIAYHDPELYNHLDNNMFYPDLYAIPWFLTMFTHVFPLNKIYHLWDTLLLGNPSFPLFAGLSILAHLRTELFSTSDFSECITMFSDLPDIDIQQCTQDAVAKYQITPSSMCVRKYDSQSIQHVLIPEEARKVPLPLKQLKSECSPQISAHDLIVLCKLEKTAFCYKEKGIPTPVKDPENPLLWKQVDGVSSSNMEAVVLDIRSEEEFHLGHVPASINLPINNAISPDGSLANRSIAKELLEETQKGKIIVIIGNNNDLGSLFARQLVRLNYQYVCVLHGGAGVLRSLGLMSDY